MRDETITTRPVPVAYRDFGGDGTPVVLLHGLGGTVAHWNRFASRLPGHRVVAVDLRGHGGSGDGPWEWDAVLDDIEAVVDHLGLGAPAVVGMSLGGWVAAMWGLRHPECPAVVNLDGHRSALTRPEHYLGIDPATRDAELARLREMFLTPQDGPYDQETVATLRGHAAAGAEAMGGDAEQARESFDRQLVTRGGATYVRPEWALLEEVRAALDATDMFDRFARIRCPFLLVVGTEMMPAQEAFAELTRAHQRGIAEAVRRLTEARPDLRVEWITASHAMLVERPDDLAALTIGMLDH
jgi:pimeloyl-ACP methyl ester carboxylesterase